MRPGREELAPMRRVPSPGQQPAPDDAQGSGPDEQRGGRRATSTHSSSRAVSAWVTVTPSTYSSSPPTGKPRARRETFTPATPGQQVLQVGRGRLAFKRGVGRQDHLAHPTLIKPALQQPDPQRFRADPVERGKPAAENDISSAKRAGSFQHRHPRRLLHHTEQRRVAPRVAADIADGLLGRLAALGTGMHPFADRDQRFGQGRHPFTRLLKQMIRQTLGSLPPHAGQPCQLADERLQGAHTFTRPLRPDCARWPAIRRRSQPPVVAPRRSPT